MTTVGESVLAQAGLGEATNRVVDAVLGAWPGHLKFLRTSLGGRSDDVIQTTEVIANLLLKVADSNGVELTKYADDYRYLCEKIVFPEELFFRRNGRYRLSTFDEAAKEVYDNTTLMTRYMNGLFVSDALWFNHVSAMNDFAKTYLLSLRAGGTHLEIGPGHGMLLHLALRFGNFKSLSAWDVSATSIEHTAHVLDVLGQSGRVALRQMNLYAPEALAEHRGQFDTVVLSEVLEHLEQPAEALAIIRDLLAPGGSVWINVPANGPAPDHLFLLRSLAEAESLVVQAGLKVTRSIGFPVAGSSLERALREELPISCVVVGTKV